MPHGGHVRRRRDGRIRYCTLNAYLQSAAHPFRGSLVQNTVCPPGECGSEPTMAIWCPGANGPLSPGLTLMGGPSQPAFVVVSIMLVTVLGAMSSEYVDG